MSAVFLFAPFGVVVTSYDADDLGSKPVGGPFFGRERLPTEPIGTFTMRVTNAVVGSRYRIERVVGGSLATPTGFAEGVVATSTFDLALDLYAVGNSNNDLKIKVRKGTAAPKYQPFETQATAQAGVVTAYVAQTPDAIA